MLVPTKAEAAPRKLGLWMSTALVIGNMIGSGGFLPPSSLAPYGGLSLVGWGVTAIGAICMLLNLLIWRSVDIPSNRSQP